MPQTLDETHRELNLFRQGLTPMSLLARFAAGRIRHFWFRQTVTVLGALSLAVLTQPWVGLLAAVIALSGELLDTLALRKVLQMARTGGRYARASALATASGTLQALTIAGCVMLALHFGAPHDPGFFAMAFLAGASMNAVIVLPYHRPSTIARLAVFGATGALYFLVHIPRYGTFGLSEGFDALGMVMMAVMVGAFARSTMHSTSRIWGKTADLLQGKTALAETTAALRDRQSELRQLSLVARYANDSVIVCGPARKIQWVNEAFSLTTGYSLKEAQGRTPAELLDGPMTDPQISRRIDAEVAAGRSVRAEIQNYRKDGVPVWMDVNVVPLVSADGQVELSVAIERNINQAKAHEKELASAMLAAQEGERAKSAFLATVSHEIRTPMNGILGMVDLLADTPLAPRQVDYLGTIRDSAEGLLRIINDILDFSRLDAGKMAFAHERLSPAVLVRSACDLMRGPASEKGLWMRVTGAEDLPEAMLGDESRLRQILVNLLGNAVKFTDSGGVTLEASAAPSADGTGWRLRIRVRDTGIGVPSDRADAIFERFEQADPEITRRFGGTGLGLAISRLLARDMGGDLVLCPGASGACFELTVTLPAAETPARPDKAAPVPSPAPPDPALAGRRVVLAEDNATNRMIVQAYLEGTGLTLFCAENGAEAVDLARETAPDVILMDMSMPVLDGVDATRAIRALPGDLGARPVIIALTANAFDSDRAQCLDAGMDDFLAKPVRKTRLLRAVSRACEGRAEPTGPGPAEAVSPDNNRN